MIDDHAAFQRAIVENPTDSLTRLVYADYLEETGEPHHVARAHLIRAQIALLDPSTEPDGLDRLAGLEERLLEMFQEDWDRELPFWLTEQADIGYRRGFAEHVALPYSRFATVAADVFATVPLRSLHLSAPVAFNAANMQLFSQHEQMANIEYLKLGPNLNYLTEFTTRDDGELAPAPLFLELMSAPTLTGLRVLDLSGNRVTDGWLVAFVSALPSAAFGTTLEELILSECVHITNAGGNTLATARSLFELKRLVLKDTALSAATRNMLRRSFGDRVSF